LCKNKVLRVLLIDNYDSFTFNIVSLLKQCGVDEICIMQNDTIDFVMADTFQYIIISPGPKTPQESGEIVPFIQHFATTKNILGICLGHQAIGVAFGARLIQLQHPQHGAQQQLQVVENQKIFEHIAANTTIGLYHSWAIDASSLPACFSITSNNANGVIMSIAHQSFHLIGLQFHPESYITTQGLQMMKNWLGIIDK
jgi:anthranilate synthase component 2